MKRYIFLLIFITFLVYLNSFGNGFVRDDLNNIVQNNALNGPLGLREIFLKPAAQIFYRPVPYLTIRLDWLFWQENPFGYHLTNFAFHLACVILIFFLGKRLTQSEKLSVISALIFAVHPIHTEAVSYISGRSSVICGFFIFLSFWLYLNFLDDINKMAFYLWGALFCFLLALFSKEIALVFPLVILSYGLYFCRNSSSRFRTKFIGAHLLFVLLAIAYLLFRYLFVQSPAVHIGFGKFFLFPKIFLFYFRLLAFPINLHMQHSLQEADLSLKMPLFLSIMIFLAVVFAAIKFTRERPRRFGLVWFVLWILPFLGIFQFNADMAEHWLYIGSFGFFLIAASLLNKINLLKHKFIFSLMILVFCFLTIQRNAIWQDDISIYKDTLRYNPNDPRLHYNLGNGYLRKGLLDEAACEYLTSLEGKPDYAYALNNLGLVKERQKELRTAYGLYRQAASLSSLEASKRNLLRLEFFTSAFADEGYFDHSLYAEVLKKFVKDGKVDYASLKNEPHLLNSYLGTVEKLDIQAFDSLPPDELLALYLNVYNAFTLKVIAEHYPLKSIKDIPEVWDRFKVKVAGSERTLNQIEHEILRREFKEPRIHFTLVCASKGCPKLQDGPFNGKDLHSQLDEEARKFINDNTKVRLDKKSNILYLSSIFKWFEKDFGDVVEFVSKYLPVEAADFIRENNPRIKYLKYDWSLNE